MTNFALIEFDLAGAEWVVTGYIAGDQNMIDVSNSGKSPHVVTGSLISGAPEEFVLEEHKLIGSLTDPDGIRELRSKLTVPPGIFLPRSMSIRQAGKKSNHGCNYYMRYRRFALTNEMPETDAEPIVRFYSEKAYPGLNDYWQSTQTTLRRDNRCLTNCLGRKVRMVGEWGIELFMAAYAFRPQSTVFDVCRIGMIRAYQDDSLEFDPMELGAQVHDSIMVMYPLPATLHEKDKWIPMAHFIDRMVNHHMRVELRYKGATDGIERAFTLNSDAKIGLNWGEMHSLNVTQDYDALIDQIQSKLLAEDTYVGAEPEWQATDLLGQTEPSDWQGPGTPEL